MSTPLKGADVLAAIKPHLRETETQIVLRPDLIDAWEAAEAALAAEQAKPKKGRLTGEASKEEKRLAQVVQDAEKALEDAAVTFRFRAMAKPDYDALCAEFPPRPGVQIDQLIGHNRDAVEDAMVRRSMYDPNFDDESWQQLMTVMNQSEWNELKTAVAEVNGAMTSVPKSRRASLVLSRREPASEQPDPGVSPPDDSPVENPENATTT